MMSLDPDARPTAAEILEMPIFDGIHKEHLGTNSSDEYNAIVRERLQQKPFHQVRMPPLNETLTSRDAKHHLVKMYE
eukprot:scaffold673285_cov59-Prasinocladus_malaysianus.AAC.1